MNERMTLWNVSRAMLLDCPAATHSLVEPTKVCSSFETIFEMSQHQVSVA